MHHRHKIEPTHITCHGCGKSVPRQQAFFMYNFECCSNSCIEPLRIERQNQERLKEKNGKYIPSLTDDIGSSAA